MSVLTIAPRVDKPLQYTVPLAEIPANTFAEYIMYATAFCMSDNGAANGMRRLRDGDKLFIGDDRVDIVSLERADELGEHCTVFQTADNGLRAVMA